MILELFSTESKFAVVSTLSITVLEVCCFFSPLRAYGKDKKTGAPLRAPEPVRVVGFRKSLCKDHFSQTGRATGLRYAP